MTDQKHVYKEAFMLMTYQCQVCGVEEVIWNSRDGITPFCVGCRRCSEGLMNHVQWGQDRYAPTFEPPAGSRIFVNLTMERARDGARKLVEENWSHPEYPMSKCYDSRKEAIEKIAAESISQFAPCSPDLIEVEEGVALPGVIEYDGSQNASAWEEPPEDGVPFLGMEQP